MRFGAVVLILVLVSSASAQSAPPASRVLQGRVSQVSEFPPVGSGVTVTWISITVIKDEDLQRRLGHVTSRRAPPRRYPG